MLHFKTHWPCVTGVPCTVLWTAQVTCGSICGALAVQSDPPHTVVLAVPLHPLLARNWIVQVDVVCLSLSIISLPNSPHLKKGGKMKNSGLWEGDTCSPLSPPSGRNVWQEILRAVPKNTQSCSHCTVSRCSPSGANTQIHVNDSRPVAPRRNESLSRGNGIAWGCVRV